MQGDKMYQIIKELFPINRSITGEGVRKSLEILDRHLPSNLFMKKEEIKSGQKVYDWTIPNEWNVNEAYIITPEGKKIADFNINNLHLMGYSIPVDMLISKQELDKHLYTLKDQPNAIPYVTSYYKEDWGFSLTYDEFKDLSDGEYRVYIDSKLAPGSLTYADLILPGKTSEEIFFSTYICHPSMANNELSGPALMTALINYISQIDHYYSYRFVIVPETIGSITYIHNNLESLKKNIVAGYNLSCVGNNNSYSFLPSRYGNTLADDIAKHIMRTELDSYVSYTFLERGSDERQYCSPGVDLPVASVMRTKYGEYKEYHTSLDNLDYVSPKGLQGSYDIYTKIIDALENNFFPLINVKCEPQLGKRNLYPNTSIKGSGNNVRNMMNVLAYSDGTNSVLDIAKLTEITFSETLKILKKITDNDKSLIDLNRNRV